MNVSQLRRELAFEIFMAANPYPKPDVAIEPLRHGAVITRHAHRPKARVGAQPPNKGSRTQTLLWRSRTVIEVAVIDFSKSVGIGLELDFDLIAQR